MAKRLDTIEVHYVKPFVDEIKFLKSARGTEFAAIKGRVTPSTWDPQTRARSGNGKEGDTFFLDALFFSGEHLDFLDGLQAKSNRPIHLRGKMFLTFKYPQTKDGAYLFTKDGKQMISFRLQMTDGVIISRELIRDADFAERMLEMEQLRHNHGRAPEQGPSGEAPVEQGSQEEVAGGLW